MAGICFFNRINGKRADRRDGQVIHGGVFFFMDCLFFCLFSHENNPPLNQECHFDYYCITNVEAIPIVFADPMFEQLIFCGSSLIYSFIFPEVLQWANPYAAKKAVPSYEKETPLQQM
ncbi:hypothetical protein D3C74_302860 [compost metagenome]